MLQFDFIDWLTVLLHFMTVSLMAVGGAVTVIPEMHRYLVSSKAWMTDPQFSASIAIAQSAPGPNILVVGMMGWHIGINAASPGIAQYAMGTLGLLVAMLGVMVPSSLLTYATARWVNENREKPLVVAFKQGLSPIVVSTILATSWILTAANDDPVRDWTVWLTTAVTVLLIWRTRIHILWLLGVGAVLGGLGYI